MGSKNGPPRKLLDRTVHSTSRRLGVRLQTRKLMWHLVTGTVVSRDHRDDPLAILPTSGTPSSRIRVVDPPTRSHHDSPGDRDCAPSVTVTVATN